MWFQGIFLLLSVLSFGVRRCYGDAEASFDTENAIPMEIHRVIAVGDVHGDLHNFRQILTMADVVTTLPGDTDRVLWKPKWEVKEIELQKLHRTRLRTTLVQLGDLIDRGEDDLGVLEMALSLFTQVRESTSDDNVVLLLGNHELLNLQGLFHYVHPESMGGFISKALRKQAFEAGENFHRFLLENFTVVHIDENTAFVHGGVTEKFALKGAEALNIETMKAIRERNYRHSLLGGSGPLWTRELIIEASNGRCEGVQKSLFALGVERIVVGHTPQRSGHVETFCNDSLIAVDVGLSRWMYGNLAALEMMVTSYKVGSEIRKKVVLREIVASDARRTQTLDESLNDPLFLEELQHAVEGFRRSEGTHPHTDIRDDL